MRKHIFFTHMALALCMLSSLNAMGQIGQMRQEQPLQLINPDGSAAADCVAAGIIASGVYLNEQLALSTADGDSDVLISPDGRQIVSLNANESGILSIPAEAKAVVAQNQHGFAFVPPGALTGRAKLRPWAKLRIDISNVPEQLRSKCQLRILWKNDFAGDIPSTVLQYMRPTEDPFGGPSRVDPFGSPSAAPPDWRFHNYATRSQSVDVADQTIVVPPGEVTIVVTVLDSGLGFESASSSSMLSVTLGIVRTVSNQTAEFALPTFGSAHGRLVGNVNLPNWGRASDQATRIIAVPVRAADVPPPRDLGQLLAGMAGSQDSRSDPFAAPTVARQDKIADVYARYFASVEGTNVRTSGIGIGVAATDEQGEFTFDALPIGEYELPMMPLDATQETLTDYESAQGLTTVGSDSPEALRFVIKANALAELGEVRWRLEQRAEEAVKPRDGKVFQSADSSLQAARHHPDNSNPFAVAAQSRIEAALNKPVENIDFIGMPLAQVMEMLSDDMNIPIVFNLKEFKVRGFSMDAPITMNLPPVTLRSVLNLVLDQVASGELTFVARDEVLLITTREDAAKNPGTSYSQVPGMSKSLASGTASATDDRATEIIERWLKSAPQNADRSDLMQQLETHLSAEFDANQQTRRAEIDRLQQLLEQSRTWLDQRQQQREAIIQGRVQELLK